MMRDASILGSIYEAAKSGASKEEFLQLEEKIESKRAKKLAIKMFNRGVADANRLANDAIAEYYKLSKEYRQLAGKNFKRNGWEIHHKMSKLDAVKRRVSEIQGREELRLHFLELNRRNGPDFTLYGAL